MVRQQARPLHSTLPFVFGQPVNVLVTPTAYLPGVVGDTKFSWDWEREEEKHGASCVHSARSKRQKVRANTERSALLWGRSHEMMTL